MTRTQCLAGVVAAAIAAPTLHAGNKPLSNEHVDADEVRAIVAQMLADADTRSSLQGAGAAGHDGKYFYLASPDNNFRLNIGGVIQFRYIANFRDDEQRVDAFGDPTFTADEFEGGFEHTRVKLKFTGHAFDPGITYKIQGEFGADGDLDLEDAFVGFKLNDNWTAYAGQVRLPVLWEDVISDNTGLTIEKSVVCSVFNPGRSKAVWTHWSTERLRAWLAFSDGAASANTAWNAANADYAFTARGEWMFAGTDWAVFNTMSSFPGQEIHGKLGLAAHYQYGPNDRDPDTDELEVVPYTADIQIKGDGWNVFASGVGRYIEVEGGDDFTDYGVVVQGGVFLPDSDVELFARYDAVIPDDDREGDDTFNTVTAGINWFVHGQAVRFTFDVQYFIDDTLGNDVVESLANSSSGTKIGLLPSGEESQVAVRAQVQLLF